MRTKEFIEKVEALGYEVEKTEFGSLNIFDKYYGYDGTDYLFRLKEYWKELHVGKNVCIVSDERINLFNVIAEYLNTPPADREEEKKYYLRLVTPPILKKQVTEYLRKSEYLEYYTTGLSKNTGDEKIKTIFTESEIAEMDITGFVKDEVEG